MPLNNYVNRQQLTKPYHQHHHLLIQFILAELIAANREIEAIFKILHKSSDREETINLLMPHLIKLSGSTLGYMRLFSWNDDSVLAKLKTYCAYFCQRGGAKDNNRTNMHYEANQAWLLSLQTLENARMCAAQATRADGKKVVWDPNALYSPLHKTVRAILRLARLTAKVIPQFRNDENVVFYLVRNAKAIDALYGPNFTSKTLNKLIPKRAKSGVEQFLVKRYTDRGFEHILPLIRSNMSALD